MYNSLSYEEFNQIVASAPADMQLPIYIGKHNNEPVYVDLVKAKSIAMHGEYGVSGVCLTSFLSMLKARGQVLRKKYFLCASCFNGFNFICIPFAVDHITNSCTTIYDLLHCYNYRKNTLKKLSEMTPDELKDSDNIYSYEEYEEYLAKNPRLYIFEGCFGQLSEDTLNDSGLNLDAVKEAFEDAYKFHIYILISYCVIGKNALAKSIHTSVNVKRTEKGHCAELIQDGAIIEKNICADYLSEETINKIIGDINEESV